jgi:hypothetical protein
LESSAVHTSTNKAADFLETPVTALIIIIIIKMVKPTSTDQDAAMLVLTVDVSVTIRGNVANQG